MESIAIKNLVKMRYGIFRKCNYNLKGKISYYQMRDYDVEMDKFVCVSTTECENKTVQKHFLCKKELLITTKGSRYYCAVYDPEVEEKALASSAFLILKVIDSRITPEYLCWYLNRPEISKGLLKERRKWLYYFQKDLLAELKIPLIDLESQECIYNIYKLGTKELKIQQELFKERQRLYFRELFK